MTAIAPRSAPPAPSSSAMWGLVQPAVLLLLSEEPRHGYFILKDVADFCARALGPLATLVEPGLPARVGRNVCYAPAYTIMGGTTQILRNIIGDRMLGLPR